MKQKLSLIAAATLLALGAATAQARPYSGFSIDGGFVNTNMSGPTTFWPYTTTYSGSGLSLGIDYQIALSPTLSLNPFLMTSGESGGGDMTGNSIGHGIFGLQVRFWSGDVFFGGHVASYSEVITDPTGFSISTSGPGLGVVAGWEAPYSGLYLMGQLDSAHYSYVDADIHMTGLRLSVGYRWK